MVVIIFKQIGRDATMDTIKSTPNKYTESRAISRSISPRKLYKTLKSADSTHRSKFLENCLSEVQPMKQTLNNS